MTVGVGERIRRLRDLPRDLFAAIQAITHQNEQLEGEFRSLATQITDALDLLVRLSFQVKSLDARVTETAGRLADDVGMVMAAVKSAEQGGRIHSDLGRPEVGERARQVLAELRPYRLGNASKIRLGRPNDGGYVMIDDFAEVDCAISLGIGDDVSWDQAIADRHIKVFQFDHTICESPEPNALFDFSRTKIGIGQGPAEISLQTVLAAGVRKIGDRKVILKVDIPKAVNGKFLRWTLMRRPLIYARR